MIFMHFNQGNTLQEKGNTWTWQVKSINTLINTYNNLRRSIIVIYFSPHGGPCMSEQGRKPSQKKSILQNLALIPGTLEMMK